VWSVGSEWVEWGGGIYRDGIPLRSFCAAAFCRIACLHILRSFVLWFRFLYGRGVYERSV
jgi:hypothetical protein